MLEFLGSGSAFNTGLGNTSAYMKKENHLLVIDCGGLVFHTLKERGLLEKLESLQIVITHTHPDHVGSLGELIFYVFYALNIVPKLYFPERDLMLTFLNCIGVEPHMYDLISDTSLQSMQNPIEMTSLEFIPVSHVPTIPSYGFIMHLPNERFYYSGDANALSETLVEKLAKGDLDTIYQDTCGLDYEGNNHLCIKYLEGLIPVALRSRVICMHLDAFITVEEIEKKGFGVIK